MFHCLVFNSPTPLQLAAQISQWKYNLISSSYPNSYKNTISYLMSWFLAFLMIIHVFFKRCDSGAVIVLLLVSYNEKKLYFIGALSFCKIKVCTVFVLSWREWWRLFLIALSDKVWSNYCEIVYLCYAKFLLGRFILEHFFDFTSRVTFSLLSFWYFFCVIWIARCRKFRLLLN